MDIPSGIEGTKDEILNPAIKATATVTLGFPKKAFKRKAVLNYTGKLLLADISIPPVLYQSLGINLPQALFQKGTLLEITS